MLPGFLIPGLAAGSYCMDAAFMLFQRHGWDIHAVRPGAGVASVTEARFRHAAARVGEALDGLDQAAGDAELRR